MNYLNHQGEFGEEFNSKLEELKIFLENIYDIGSKMNLIMKKVP